MKYYLVFPIFALCATSSIARDVSYICRESFAVALENGREPRLSVVAGERVFKVRTTRPTDSFAVRREEPYQFTLEQIGRPASALLEFPAVGCVSDPAMRDKIICDALGSPLFVLGLKDLRFVMTNEVPFVNTKSHKMGQYIDLGLSEHRPYIIGDCAAE